MNFKVLFVGLALVCAIQAAPTSEDDLDQVVDIIEETKVALLGIRDDFEKKIMEPLTWLSNQFREEVPKELDRVNRQIKEAVDTAAAQGIDVKNCVESQQLDSVYEESLIGASKCHDDGDSTLKKAQNAVQGFIAILNTMLDMAQKAARDCPSYIDVNACRTQAAYRLYMEINKFDSENRAKMNETLRDIDEGHARLSSCVQRVYSVFADKTGKYLESTLQCINNIIVNTSN